MTQALTISHLEKTYSNGVHAVKDVNLSVQQGDFYGLLGPNGAGKSSTIGIISSLVNKTGGKVTVFGHDLDTERNAAKSCIGLVPQEFNFGIFEKISDIVINQAGYYGVPFKIACQRMEKYFKQLDLWHKRNDIARNLSGGMKRRLMIARALMHEPRLLILDEPTAGVDLEVRRSMWDFLRGINQAGVTIILTTHYLEEAENACNRIAIINHGEIIKDSTKQELLRELNVESFLFYTRDKLAQDFTWAEYEARVVDDFTLELQVSKEASLNKVMAGLAERGIEVISMKNKVNRLEELFLKLTTS